jgi:aspartate/methionine/tyrosine aminotransferase
MEARRWLETADFSEQPLINVSQAAPINPPPAEMRAAMAAMMEEDDTHLYGAVLGNDALRTELASRWARHFTGTVSPAQVAITSGCNQAFSATISAICADGDEVLLPTPWYFNHKMWLDMAGVTTVPLDTGAELTPDVATAKALIGPRTKAIVLVTPNNPAGTEYSSETVRAFYDLAKAHGLKLLIDETYRDFDSRDGAPHTLVGLPDWDETLIQLYSFSKAYRLTGHRVGAMMASPAFWPKRRNSSTQLLFVPTNLVKKQPFGAFKTLATGLRGSGRKS